MTLKLAADVLVPKLTWHATEQERARPYTMLGCASPHPPTHTFAQLTLDDILAAPSGPRSLPETERRAQAMEATVKEMQEQALLLLMGKAPPETPKQAASAESQAGAAGGSKAASDAKQGAGKEGAKGQAKGEESKEKGAEHDKGGGKGKSKAAPKTKAPFAPPKKAQVEIEVRPGAGLDWGSDGRAVAGAGAGQLQGTGGGWRGDAAATSVRL